MADLLVTGGAVVTMDDRREVITDGAVAVEDDRIVAVGSDDAVRDAHDADRVIDATGHAVLPGFINTHTHVSDILLRGAGTTDGRTLYDWLYNVKKPAVNAMTAEDHAVASALYCHEAIGAGVTTFVENATGGGGGYAGDVTEAKFDVYETAGMRNVYARAFVDRDPSPEMVSYLEREMSREPDVAHVDPGALVADTDEALDAIESLVETYHGASDGRQSVWPSPYITWGVSPEGLERAYALAERYDVMTTAHVSETPHEEAGHQSSVSYLDASGFLGERALLGHCVHLSDRDVRLLAATDTRVAHNAVSNLTLGTGIAPVPEMVTSGVTVSLGTDNACYDSPGVLDDLRTAMRLHRGIQGDTGVLTAENALEMATIGGARAIGRADELGSIEAGKLADLVLVDLDRAHLTPTFDVPASLVYNARGAAVDTVVCNGTVIMDDGRVDGIETAYPDLLDRAGDVAADVVDRAGLSDILLDASWTATGPRE